MAVLSPSDMAAFRALTEELEFADSYQLLGVTATTPDDAGGYEATTGVVEAGPCAVTAGMSQPDEAVVGSRIATTAPYTIELPYATQATGRHMILADGRTFQIIDVLRDGYFGTNARAICEEVR